MSQFDFYSFYVQIFWLVVGSFAFYLIYLKFFLKNIAQVLKMRFKLATLIKAAKVKSTAANIYSYIVSTISL